MPLSPNTDAVEVTVSPGVEYIITADGGSVAVTSSVNDASAGTINESEGTVADTERMRYLGPANSLGIIPSAASVFWTVTPVLNKAQ